MKSRALALTVLLCLVSLVAFAAPKYVFVFIGDGMATPQIAAAEAYLGSLSDSFVDELSFTTFPVQALTTTYSNNAYITDSAAAATALACGYKTDSGVIAMDPGKMVEYKTIAEMAKEAGMKVGILSSVNLDHATPACYYAHNASRKNYYEINIAMANSDFDYFAGGEVRLSKTPEGQPTAEDVMRERGWTIVDTREALMALEPSDTTVYAYNHGFSFNALDYTIDQKTDDITLAEFTRKGIELLDNPNGFFMMVEAGKIDWACHANDAGASIHDTLAFSNAVQEAIDFMAQNPDDTLIIVTGDHECGGLTMGFAGTGYSSAFDVLGGQTVSYEWFNQYVLAPYKSETAAEELRFADLEDEIAEYFGLTELSDRERTLLEDAFAQSMLSREERASDEATYLLYGGYEPLTVTITHLLNQRAGLAWTSYSHTGIPVPTFAKGVGQDLFGGYYDNTDVFWKLVQVMELNAYLASY